MKKILALVLAVAVIAAAAIIIKSCVGKNDGDTPQTPTGEQSNTVGATQGSDDSLKEDDKQEESKPVDTKPDDDDEWSSSTDMEWSDAEKVPDGTKPTEGTTPTEPATQPTGDTQDPEEDDEDEDNWFNDEWSSSTDIVWH